MRLTLRIGSGKLRQLTITTAKAADRIVTALVPERRLKGRLRGRHRRTRNSVVVAKPVTIRLTPLPRGLKRHLT